MDIGASSKRSHAQGLPVPVSERVEREVEQWTSAISKDTTTQGIVRVLYLHLTQEPDLLLDVAPETSHGSTSLTLPGNAPRYVLLAHREGEQVQTLFVYACPTQSVVRDRMVYASSRSSVLDYLTSVKGIPVDKRVETAEPTEFDEAFVRASLELDKTSAAATSSNGFVKKKLAGPGSGPRRLVK